MWIEQLDIRGFKRLHGIFRFGRGLTFVVGDNEAGKSTLHEALIRSLFGFSRAERVRWRGASAKDGCAPWRGGDFGLIAVLREAGGRALRAEWDLRAHTLRLRDHDTGEDCTAGVPAARGEVHLGRHLVGLGAVEFRDVCCLDQAVIAAVRRTQDLVLALQQAVETRDRDLGIDDAVRLLNDFLRVELGVHAGHLGDLPAGPLSAARRERESLRAALATCEAARTEVTTLAAGLVEREFSVGVLRRASLEVEQRLRLAERDELESRFERARRLMERARDVPQHPLELPEATVAGALRLLAAADRLRERAGGLDVEAASREPSLHELSARRRELATRLDALAIYTDVDPSAEARVLELRGRRGELAAAGAPPAGQPAPEPDSALVRYRAARLRLIELESAIEEARWSRRGLLGAGLAGLAAMWLAGQALFGDGIWAGPAAGAAALGAALLAAAATGLARAAGPERIRAPYRRALARELADLGATSREELEERAADEDRRLAGAQALARARAEQELERRARAADVEEEIARALDAAGAPSRPVLDERVSAYLAACRGHAERAMAAGEIEAVRARLLEEQRPLEELRALREELAEVEQQLAAAWALLGVEEADPPRARAAFEERLRRSRADAGRLARASEAAATLREVLAGEDLEALADRASEAARAVEEHAARHGRLAAGGGERAALESERARLEEELRAAEVAIAELRTRVSEREREAGDPGALKGRLAEVEARIAAMDRARDAVRLAREELRAAAREAHRRFAPRLNEALRRHLPALTGGRYRRAVVDDELRIFLESPETGQLVPATALSRGTQDQIYLLQRLELVRLLEQRPGEIPILLDDPFARFDERRRRSALLLLREVAAERQVVLFTEDPRLVGEAREVCPDCALIELPPPEVPAAPPVPPDGSGAAPLAPVPAGLA